MEDKDTQTLKTVNVVGTFKDIATTLGGLTAVALAMLWIIGRSYNAGYWEALNIPLSQINLSIWDYAEISWFRAIGFIPYITFIVGPFIAIGDHHLIYFPLRLIPRAISLLIFIILFGGTAFVLLGEKILSPGARSLLFGPLYGLTYTCLLSSIDIWAKKKETDDFPYSSSIHIKATDVTVIIVSLAFTLWIILGDVKIAGAQNARLYLTERALQIKMVLNAPVLVDVQPTVMYTGANSLYVYDSMYLLTYNDGHYFVFKEVSPECKPAQVFVVKEDHVLSMQYPSSAPLSVGCIPVPITPIPPLLPPTATPTP